MAKPVILQTNKACLRKAENQLEKHQMGFDGEHIGEVTLRNVLNRKGVKLTSHKHEFDILTSREAWEVKTVGIDSKYHQMSVKAKQKLEKTAWAKKAKKKPQSMLIVVNKSAEVYVRSGLGKFRTGGMKKIKTYKDWRKELGHGRTERWPYLPMYKKTESVKFIPQRAKLPTKYNPFVTPYTEKEYAEMGVKTYLSETGTSGYALTKDKDLISVFSLERGQGTIAIKSAIAKGAKTLDCFDGPLTKIYKEVGFVEYKRLPWDEQYKPLGWSHTKYDEPDVVFMRLKGTKTMESIEEKKITNILKKKEVTAKFKRLHEEWIAFMYPDLAKKIKKEN